MEQANDDVMHIFEGVPTWMDFGMRLGISSALHPFEYAKVLIQVGVAKARED